ncbi:2-C-methyl-D-erythritol 4-phosphate cytidylyltransferase [Vibrio zhanjiangensis]|uniref:2-C-methyl-D-erythritol 4-phosphate cytidylyltransferase n=1 Tax=Vibrio zhanjiangensis TaxID=1046128 RepID=A0ABQ6F580_9VIBR|nr:2-C-methyl-D-erythritol 4-phosphate cytidylyltransferase [Vibrio zhanjiangensis]GLT20134.1 2-C-methyl-D-erythritol 4-phosphate cytidylyltransferase [Vibrio zhanjiangensis]
MNQQSTIIALVPAAGVGSRMGKQLPKQYLVINNKCVLEHTVDKLLDHPDIDKVVVVLSENDTYFPHLSIACNDNVLTVVGGQERADSVLAGLTFISEKVTSDWVMVHDAARPCFSKEDIDNLIEASLNHAVGGILASPVRDTMKRSNPAGDTEHTVDRERLWHALTPQMFRTEQLMTAISEALLNGVNITDEASAMEWSGYSPALIKGSMENIKITQPEDLALAEFYLTKNKG